VLYKLTSVPLGSDSHPYIVFEYYTIELFSLTECISCIIDLHLNALTIDWEYKKGIFLYLYYQKMGSSCSIVSNLIHLLTELKSGPRRSISQLYFCVMVHYKLKDNISISIIQADSFLSYNISSNFI
jgi:hypothetical protein